MTENWDWWVVDCEERYHTQCNTREEAINLIKEEQPDGAWITEAIQTNDVRLSQYFHADGFLETADERAADDYGDEDGDADIFDMSSEDQESLDRCVKAAIEAWQRYRNLKFKGWRFQNMRNTEFISFAEDQPNE